MQALKGCGDKKKNEIEDLLQNLNDPPRNFVCACKSFVGPWKLYVCLRKICDWLGNFEFACKTFASPQEILLFLPSHIFFFSTTIFP